jgi:hypothetical protein
LLVVIGIGAVPAMIFAGKLIAPSIIGSAAQHVGFRFTYAAVALLLLVVAVLAGKTAAADGVRA